ncbi:hypothetical protein J6590_089860 [Homalodisca vitripennis]|nr:hypothetical protein J6590_089860 [Homalodisca vitripennis]
MNDPNNRLEQRERGHRSACDVSAAVATVHTRLIGLRQPSVQDASTIAGKKTMPEIITLVRNRVVVPYLMLDIGVGSRCSSSSGVGGRSRSSLLCTAVGGVAVTVSVDSSIGRRYIGSRDRGGGGSLSP